MEVTLAGMSSLLLWYSSPVQTRLLPPSTAHKPESAPANDTAPWRKDVKCYSTNSHRSITNIFIRAIQSLTHKAVDADTLTVVNTGDGCNDVVDEDL